MWFVRTLARMCDLLKTTWIDVADQIVFGHCGKVLWNGAGLGCRLTGSGCRCICDGSAIDDICQLRLGHLLLTIWNIVADQGDRLEYRLLRTRLILFGDNDVDLLSVDGWMKSEKNG